MTGHLIHLRSSVLWCFTPLYVICRLYLCYVDLTNCLGFCVWNLSDPKDKFSFYACIMNNKVLLYLCLSSFVFDHSREWLLFLQGLMFLDRGAGEVVCFFAFIFGIKSF